MTRREFSAKAAEMCGLELRPKYDRLAGPTGVGVNYDNWRIPDASREHVKDWCASFDPWHNDADAMRLWDAVTQDDHVQGTAMYAERSDENHPLAYMATVRFYGPDTLGEPSSCADTRAEAICRCVAAWRGWEIEEVSNGTD